LLTQGVIQKAIRKNLLSIKGKKINDASLRLSKGQVVCVANFFAQYLAQDRKNFSHSLQVLAQKILDQYSVFENADFIAINKPAKIASQGGTGLSISIADALLVINQEKNAGFRLVHRLDKETSGLMLLAKNYDGAVKLTGGFKDRKVYKTYQALVHGKLANNAGVIDLDGEVTKYKLLDYWSKWGVSYVEFYPITGKEHQIRRHALELGVSIIGDKKYGDINSKEPFMMLHALNVKLCESLFDQQITISADLPEYFQQMLAGLKS
jgi:23S rRNA pseudouridine955/2504/2580 synthase